MNMLNKTVVVTGGARGIGRAICLKCAELGYHVAFNYHSNKESAQLLEKEILDKGLKCQSRQLDIADFEGVKGWMASLKEQFGSIDVLINNAGIIADKPLMMMTESDWRAVIDTNLNGMFNATRNVIVDFMKRKGGIIINISSISGIIGLAGQTNYSASKGAMNAFTKALAKEVARFNIKVNAVAPGFIETDILKKFNDEQKQTICANIPLGRIGTSQDVANTVAFLLSDAAAYITGQVIQVDGGLAIR